MPTEAEDFHAALTGQVADATPKPTPPATKEPAAAAPSPATGAKSQEDRFYPDREALEAALAGMEEDKRSTVLAEYTKLRNESKNLRQRVKDAEPKVAEYDRLAQASKTDAERATERATAAEARATAATQRVARAEVKAALAGLVDNPDSIIEDLNLARFVSDDGEVNDDAIAALKSKYAAFSGRRAPRPDPTQASGGNGGQTPDPAAQLASILQGQLNRQ